MSYRLIKIDKWGFFFFRWRFMHRDHPLLNEYLRICSNGHYKFIALFDYTWFVFWRR